MSRITKISAGHIYGKLTVLGTVSQNKSGTHVKVLCRCVCGKEILISSHNLKKYKSCGCSRYTDRSKPEPKEVTAESAFNCLYEYQYKRRASKRNYSFELTKDDFRKITGSTCWYCGSDPNQIFRNGRSEYTYNGIDRIDNNKGYIANNVRACCKICNMMKHSLDESIFLGKIKEIYQNLNSKITQNNSGVRSQPSLSSGSTGNTLSHSS